jgi:hypothetical protein
MTGRRAYTWHRQGDKIGPWTLIERVGSAPVKWRVRCKCGAERVKITSAIRDARKGCSRCANVHYRVGDKIGPWTLVECIDSANAKWRVRCRCGAERIKQPNAARACATGCSKCPRTRYKVGDKIGEWSLAQYLGAADGKSRWLVRCVCGCERIRSPSGARKRQCWQCNRTYKYWTSTKYDLPPPPPLDPNRVRLSDITGAVSKHYGVREAELFGPRRLFRVRVPRFMAYALARELTRNSTTYIGLRFGGRDHSTVLKGAERAAELRASNPALDADYIALKTQLTTRYREEIAA